MKRLLALFAGGFGLRALARRRHRDPGAELGPDPALELRAKLAESKAAASPEPEQSGSAEDSKPEDATPDDGADVASPFDPQARRRDVHERARDAIDELR